MEEHDEEDVALDEALERPPEDDEGTAEWYVAIGDEQVGPLTMGGVEQRWQREEVSEDSLAWRAGMADWLPVAEVDELAYLITEHPQTQSLSALSVSDVGAEREPGESASEVEEQMTPVAFGGTDQEEPAAGSDMDWAPSAASSLTQLVKLEELQKEQLAVEAQAVAESSAATGDVMMPAIEEQADPFAAVGVEAKGDDLGGGFQLPVAPARSAGLPKWLVPVAALVLLLGVVGVAVAFVTGRIGSSGGQTSEAGVEVALADSAEVNGEGKAEVPTAQVPTKPAEADPKSDSAKTQAKTPAKSPAKSTPKPKPKPKRTTSSSSKPKAGGGDPLDDVFAAGKKKSGAGRLSSWTKPDVLKQFNKNKGSLNQCVQEVQRRKALAPGKYKVLINWKIAPSGSSTGQVAGPPQVLPTTLPGCISRKMRAWKLPSSPSGAPPIRNFPYQITIR